MKELGMMGQMFKGIIFTVVIALMSSLFVAIFLVPVLAGKFLPLSNRKEKPVKSKILKKLYALLDVPMNALTAVYKKALDAALTHRAITVTVCVVTLITAFAFIPTMTINMMPNGRDDSVSLNVNLPIGTTLDSTAAVMAELEEICKKEVKGYTTTSPASEPASATPPPTGERFKSSFQKAKSKSTRRRTYKENCEPTSTTLPARAFRSAKALEAK